MDEMFDCEGEVAHVRRDNKAIKILDNWFSTFHNIEPKVNKGDTVHFKFKKSKNGDFNNIVDGSLEIKRSSGEVEPSPNSSPEEDYEPTFEDWKQLLIVRQSCLKAAVEVINNFCEYEEPQKFKLGVVEGSKVATNSVAIPLQPIIILAEEFENWVFR